MSIVEKAWAAGFYDGEGSLYSHASGNGRRYPRLHVSQVDRMPLDRFQAAVGAGSVRGPYQGKGKNKSPHWQFVAGGIDSVTQTLRELLPYMSEPKVAQALRVVAECREAFAAVPVRRPIRDAASGLMTADTEPWPDSPAVGKLAALHEALMKRALA